MGSCNYLWFAPDKVTTIRNTSSIITHVELWKSEVVGMAACERQL